MTKIGELKNWYQSLPAEQKDMVDSVVALSDKAYKLASDFENTANFDAASFDEKLLMTYIRESMDIIATAEAVCDVVPSEHRNDLVESVKALDAVLWNSFGKYMHGSRILN